jgi:disulfide bond formation protein DsbB
MYCALVILGLGVLFADLNWLRWVLTAFGLLAVGLAVFVSLQAVPDDEDDDDVTRSSHCPDCERWGD